MIDSELLDALSGVLITGRSGQGMTPRTCEGCRSWRNSTEVEAISFQTEGGVIMINLCPACLAEAKGSFLNSLPPAPSVESALFPPTATLFPGAFRIRDDKLDMMLAFEKAATQLCELVEKEEPLQAIAPANNSSTEMGDYLDELSVEEPEFWKVLQEFCGGNFTLQSGDEDEVLKSIATQVLKGRPPSVKQIKFFKRRVEHYLTARSQGRPLQTPESLQKRGTKVINLLETASHSKGRMDNKGREIVDSMLGFHKDRGYLTERQFSALESMVERAN